MVSVFSNVIFVTVHRYLYEKQLISTIVTPFFGNIVLEKDPIVRNAVIKFLLEFSLQCSPMYMGSMLDILEKVRIHILNNFYQLCTNDEISFYCFHCIV